MYIRPTLSEPRRQLSLMLSWHLWHMTGGNVLLYITASASLLMSHLMPIPGACLWRMPILDVEPTRVAIIPIIVPFDRIRYCRRSRCWDTTPKEWGHLTTGWRNCIILCCLGKGTMSFTTITTTTSPSTICSYTLSTVSASNLSPVSASTSELITRWYVDCDILSDIRDCQCTRGWSRQWRTSQK